MSAEKSGWRSSYSTSGSIASKIFTSIASTAAFSIASPFPRPARTGCPKFATSRTTASPLAQHRQQGVILVTMTRIGRFARIRAPPPAKASCPLTARLFPRSWSDAGRLLVVLASIGVLLVGAAAFFALWGDGPTRPGIATVSVADLHVGDVEPLTVAFPDQSEPKPPENARIFVVRQTLPTSRRIPRGEHPSRLPAAVARRSSLREPDHAVGGVGVRGSVRRIGVRAQWRLRRRPVPTGPRSLSGRDPRRHRRDRPEAPRQGSEAGLVTLAVRGSAREHRASGPLRRRDHYRRAMTYHEFFSHVVDVVEAVGAAILVVGGLGAFAKFAYEITAQAWARRVRRPAQEPRAGSSCSASRC